MGEGTELHKLDILAEVTVRKRFSSQHTRMERSVYHVLGHQDEQGSPQGVNTPGEGKA